jgi:CheY-like chemotaxis protein
MQDILIVAEEVSHLVLSLKEHLKHIGYNGIVVSAETESINAVTQPLVAIIIHADWNTIKQRASLTILKNRAAKAGIPIFSIGPVDGLKVLKLLVSERLVVLEFVRPLDVHISVVVTKIDNAIKLYNRQKKILVVDDSGAMLRVIKNWLGDKYSLYTANSGAMAIKFLAGNTPDLILLDYEMPVIDGKQVLEMIRSEQEFSQIPVIFLTKKDDAESIMNVKKLNPQGYLLKTLEPDQIKQAVDDFFVKQKENL